MKKTMTDSEIRTFIDAMDASDNAKYSEYHAKVLSEYNGCSDSRYSEIFLKKLWDKLNVLVYSHYQDYDSVNVLVTNNIGAKALRFAPKNSNILALNNDRYCSIASKAILQNAKLEWTPQMKFNSIADYYYISGKFNATGHQLVINTYEHDNDYYKSVDVDKKLTTLPYYLYCLVRGTEFLAKNGYICAVVPNKFVRELKEFKVSDYVRVNLVLKDVVADADYSAVIFKNE